MSHQLRLPVRLPEGWLRGQSPSLASLASLGLIALVLVSLALIGLTLLSMVKTPSVRFTAPSTAGSSQHEPLPPELRVHIDCLWYSARNHGFYQVLRSHAVGNSTLDNTRLMLGFVESTGAAACGSHSYTDEHLTQALASTVADADKHFLGAGIFSLRN